VAVANLRAQLGLNHSLGRQYLVFIGEVVRGHFGYSVAFNEPVGSLISQRAGASVALLAYGLIVAFAFGVPLAIIAAMRAGRAVDFGIRGLTTIAFAMPTFWLGLMFALIFGLKLGWFPSSGYSGGIGGILTTLTLPAFVLGLSLLAVVVRTLRASVQSVLAQEYIEAATARGIGGPRLIAIHVMRNAIMPTITVFAVNLGYLIGGTVVIEQVFQIPGLGSLLVEAVSQRDYPTVEILTLFAGAVVIGAGLLSDLLQPVLDPRVRIGARGG
jgi:peptide/nickel transport system permease protein